MDILKTLTEQGKQLGYEGEALQKFVKEQQDIQREERKANREHELEMRQMEINLREKEKNIEEQVAKLKMLEIEHAQKLELLEKGASDSGISNSSQVNVKMPKLPTFDERKDEMDSYLYRFERYAVAQNWKKHVWATSLSALLTGKALDVFARLPVDKALDYEELKSALLKRFNLTEDGFRHKFRSSFPEEGETFQQYANRLSGYVDRWLDLSEIDKTFDGLYDLIIREQVLSMCSKDLVLFIKEHVPKDVKFITTFADQYREARCVDITVLSAAYGCSRSRQITRSNLSHEKGLSTGQNRMATSSGKSVGKVDKNRSQDLSKADRRCYRCGRLGHIASDNICPSRPFQNRAASVQYVDNEEGRVRFQESDRCSRSKSPHKMSTENGDTIATCNAILPVSDRMLYVVAGESPVTSTYSSRMKAILPTASGTLGGRTVSVLRDTGCSGVVVKRSLVKDNCLTGEFQKCILANGSEGDVPIAEVVIDTPFYSGKVLCWCMDKPVYDIIIGNIPGAIGPCSSEGVQAVQTRQQAAQAKTEGKLRPLKTPEAVDGEIGPDQLRAEQEKDSSLKKLEH